MATGAADASVDAAVRAPLSPWLPVASALLGAVPVPGLDDAAVRWVRGSAARRIARRHGVTLTREARDVLARISPERSRAGAVGRRALRAVAGRVLAPLRFATRFEDGVTTWAMMAALDHYLRGRNPAEGPLRVDEATLLCRALGAAELHSTLQALRHLPASVGTGTKRLVQQVTTRGEDENRSAPERLVDGLVDALSEVPEAYRRRFGAALDEALAQLEP